MKKVMKLYLVYNNDEGYEYICECVESVVIAENETRALELAKEKLGFLHMRVVCICENINEEYCCETLSDYLDTEMFDDNEEEENDESIQLTLKEEINEEDIKKMSQQFVEAIKDANKETVSNIGKLCESFEKWMNITFDTEINLLNKLRLKQQLEYLNKRSKRFLWYVYKDELFELDKELRNTICWCSCDTIKNSCFDEEADKLIVEFSDEDNESIILCPNDGGYM
ncbi:hypothetical protein RBU49_03005 [Clostridium sp. MB40-C1]|uniref:hypothetical protein n=1 Tax=Clostridium sp. MB40-C1 TaxID=3070996 RepID=UPI0027E032A4|nr:hypothetical protein [Clostridium sp. MB40-C1]WMJ81239.1 hypothetical protein RBU49_03005 [Clostridium sp. MB40-C1]